MVTLADNGTIIADIDRSPDAQIGQNYSLYRYIGRALILKIILRLDFNVMKLQISQSKKICSAVLEFKTKI